MINKSFGTYQTYSYNLYSDADEKLQEYYRKFYNNMVSNELVATSLPLDISAGILLENSKEVIAGIFYSFEDKYPKSILIRLVWVNAEHRKNGIYTKLHRILDIVGKELGKTTVWSTIHLNNHLMVDIILKKIGYTPIMQVVKRQIE